jgi:sulfane dehydrogenase subunit SoxC
MKSDPQQPQPEDRAAGNGLLHRRAVLRGGLGVTAAGAFLQALAPNAARAQGAPAAAPAAAVTNPWLRVPGGPMSEYGERSRHEKDVHRTIVQLYKAVAPQVGWCGTPLEALHGIITPSGLHHERHHAGVPDIDPDKHELMIHGLVKRPLVFSMNALARYPTVSRIQFLECSGNSYYMLEKEPMQVTCGQIHGSVSCSEWTGIPVRTLFDEAGVDYKKAKWVIAEGSDAATMARSIPLDKLLSDGLIALYQNGEALRPEQGYPVRLFVPGWEGNVSIKWLSRMKLVEAPAMSREETMKYTDLMPDGKAMQFSMEMAVKSVITSPSGQMTLPEKGLYEVTGLAWSGTGKIKKVDVSADGGKTWAKTSLYGQELQHGLVRFRAPWQWDGSPALLQSRATDEKGRVQPTRQEHVVKYSMKNMYHYNAIQTWAVSPDGKVRNVY